MTPAKDAMYTQCPKCQTVFRVTLDQLQAREGLVRCGQCSHIFRADQHLYADMAVEAPKKPKAAPKREPAPAKKPAKNKPKAAAPTPTAKEKSHADDDVHEILAAPAPWSPPEEPPASVVKKAAAEPAPTKPKRRRKAAEDIDAPLLNLRRHAPRHSVLWILGSLVLAIALAAQLAFFYRDTLAQYPDARPLILAACEELGCSIRPHVDVARIELIDPTGIAPHPRTANALRLRATMVNRSPKAQPYPLMMVTLTDNAGRVLSRRTFAPNEYAEQPPAPQAEMPPNLAISASLDVTNPDGKAVGYQIDFLQAPLQ